MYSQGRCSVYRLSVVIPYLNEAEPFEDTLVSVLQNRPANCEVIVVHRGTYADPYDLGDEVRFVELPQQASIIASLNAGLAAASGEVVHLLQPGVLAIDGWTKSALPWFDDPRLGAVSPLVLNRSRPERVVSAGVVFTAAGARRVNGVGVKSSATKRITRREIVGPTLSAAFYRKSAVLALGGLSELVGEQLADADVALSLRALGWRSVLDPACRLVADAECPAEPLSFATGRCEERLFWRYAAAHGMFPVLILHLLAVLGRWLLRAYRWGAHIQMLGRLVAGCELRAGRRHLVMLRDLRANSRSPRDAEQTAPHDSLEPARPWRKDAA